MELFHIGHELCRFKDLCKIIILILLFNLFCVQHVRCQNHRSHGPHSEGRSKRIGVNLQRGWRRIGHTHREIVKPSYSIVGQFT
jgi:hypothetical protein